MDPYVRRARATWARAIAHYEMARYIQDTYIQSTVNQICMVTLALVPLVVYAVVGLDWRIVVHMEIRCAACLLVLITTGLLRTFVKWNVQRTRQSQLHFDLGHLYKAACGQAVRLAKEVATQERKYKRLTREIAWRHRHMDVDSQLWNQCLDRGKQAALPIMN